MFASGRRAPGRGQSRPEGPGGRTFALPQLLHGAEKEIYGDSAYASQTELVRSKAPGAQDRTNQRVRPSSSTAELERILNRLKSKVRSRVEHVFAVVKKLWGFGKVRYRGLAKNATRAFVTLGLANKFLPQLVKYQHLRLGVNYGCERVRFPAPVRAGARVALAHATTGNAVGHVALEPAVGASADAGQHDPFACVECDLGNEIVVRSGIREHRALGLPDVEGDDSALSETEVSVSVTLEPGNEPVTVVLACCDPAPSDDPPGIVDRKTLVTTFVP